MDTATKRELDQIQEKLDTPDLGIKGHVTVDLLDDRGKIKDRQEAPNYVNTAKWQRYAKWAQRLAWTWGMAATPGTLTKTADTDRDPRLSPILQNDTLGCWNDTTPENTLDKFCFGEVVAWAHRWGQGSPSNKQGLVVPTLSSLAENEIKWVWEWGTQQGNGTFQSVGWRRLGWTAATGDVLLYDYYAGMRRLRNFPTGFVSLYQAVSPNITFVSGGTFQSFPVYYNSGDGKMYCVGDSSVGRKLTSAAVTLTSAGYTLSTFTDESSNVIAAGLGGNNVIGSTFTNMAFKRMGAAGDWIMVGTTGPANSTRRPTIRRVTPAGAVTYTNANAATFTIESGFVDVAWDGTDIWALGFTNTGFISRMYKITAATGTVAATIAVSGLPTSFPSVNTSTNAMSGIEWDAANGWFWVRTMLGYIFNMDAAGVWLGVMIGMSVPPVLALTSPNTGDSSEYGNHRFSLTGSTPHSDLDFTRQIWGVSTNTGLAMTQGVVGDTDISVPTTGGVKLFSMDGQIWVQDSIANGSLITMYGAHALDAEPNFMSRSLLGSPVVKTSANAMRISYTMQFT